MAYSAVHTRIAARKKGQPVNGYILGTCALLAWNAPAVINKNDPRLILSGVTRDVRGAAVNV